MRKTKRRGRTAVDVSVFMATVLLLTVLVLLGPVEARSVPGWTAHLLCSCLQDKHILGMMITTPDLPESQYCFFVRDGREDTTNQNAAFAGRVFGTGGPDVTMKEVTSSDAVSYTCKGLYSGSRGDPKETTCPATLTVRVSAVYGQDAVLPCWCLQDRFLGMNVTRPGISNDKDCVFIRDGRRDSTNQDATCGRRMTWTGGPYVTVKNATSRDEGTYTCHASFKDRDGEIRETWCPTDLTVEGPPGGRFQDLWMELGLTVISAVIIGLILLVVIKRKSLINVMKKRCRHHQPVRDHVKEDDDDDDDGENLVSA